MKELLHDVRVKIIEILNLVNVQPDDIKEDEILVGGELGIDSIDVLELVVMIEEVYGVRIASQEIGREVFMTFKTLATYIHDNSPKFQD